ncbi:unnamed protein product [Nippostrongylus brasiliensis]|uniref:GIY-YIG domain-containing protein n=1 Tax=Nippostrongylus brasiliensis TaxID=27835 RepID=A0A0N4Y2W6_NIPBR|nr:unnamed protein product [Nippostrongylus brasiliensis]
MDYTTGSTVSYNVSVPSLMLKKLKPDFTIDEHKPFNARVIDMWTETLQAGIEPAFQPFPGCALTTNCRLGSVMVSAQPGKVETQVVYLITCQSCKEEYVGETGRPLCVRVKEHLDGLRRGTLSTPLGEHKVRRHEGLPIEVAVSILAREPDIAARRTLEAFWIAARAPKINRKEECVAVTQELAPFADLSLLKFDKCGFADTFTQYISVSDLSETSVGGLKLAVQKESEKIEHDYLRRITVSLIRRLEDRIYVNSSNLGHYL